MKGFGCDVIAYDTYPNKDLIGAAIESLKEGRLGYLGIDVYEQEEKLFFKDLSEILILDEKILRLMTFPNVLVTAHKAYFTDKALTQIADTTIRNISDLEQGTLNPANLVGTEQIRSQCRD